MTDELAITIPGNLLLMDPEVSSEASAEAGATLIDWLGIQELVRCGKASLPEPKEEEDQQTYIARVWSSLKPAQKGEGLESGISQMQTLGWFAETSLQLRVWRAVITGEWIHTPSGSDIGDIREWIRYLLTDTLDCSTSEATHLANVVEVTLWMLANRERLQVLTPDIELPDNLEKIFQRPLYRRWRSVAGKILRNIKSFAEAEQEDQKEILQDIAELVTAASDQDIAVHELDAKGRQQSPRVAPITVTVMGKDPEGRHLVDMMKLTEAQYALFHRKLAGSAEFVLKGEQTDGYRMADYCIDHANNYTRRVWNDKLGWSDWQETTPMPQDSIFEAILYQAPDQQLTVLRYWVKETE